MLRLNFGCGSVQPGGWVNFDPDPQWDAPFRSLDALDTGTFDLVVANHVLMMVPWPSLVTTMTTIRSLLKPGGVFRIIEPDLLGAFEAYLAQDRAWFPLAQEDTLAGKLCLYVTQAGATRSVFTTDWLLELCRRAGFSEAAEVVAGVSCAAAELDACALDSRADESVFVEAIR